MNNAELYHRSNALQKTDASQCLEEYGKLIKWKNGGITVLDVGCGDGSVMTDVLRKFIPSDYERLVGCDISESMIEYAKEKHAVGRTSFIIQDIQGDLPNELRGTFDHVFSFYALHWVQDQEVAFTNIYDLLSEGGECFLLFMAHISHYDVYRVLSRSTKWKFLLKDAERYISPYHDCPEPEKKVKQIMTTIGFTSVEVKSLHKIFTYHNLDDLIGHVTSINPFKIPKDIEKDFLQDYFDVLQYMRVIDNASNNDDVPIKATFNYSLILAKGKK